MSPVPCEQRDVLLNLQLRQASIATDVSSIKESIDDDIKPTLKKTEETLSGLCPAIAHHARIISKIEDIGWWISTSTGVMLVGLIIGIAVWAISKGFTPKL